MRTMKLGRITLAAIALPALILVGCAREENTAGAAADVEVTTGPTAAATTGGTGATGEASGPTGATGTTGAEDGTVDVVAVEYGFRVEGTLPAGQTDLVLRNEGEEPHELVLLALDEGRLLQDVRAYLRAEGPRGRPPKWVSVAGGTFAKPGKTSKPLSAELEPATYVMACFVEAPNGKSHAELGMLEQVTVG